MMFGAALRILVLIHLKHQPSRTLLTILGVALGTGALMAIDLANESAVQSFRKTVSTVTGQATLTVTGNGTGLDPRLVDSASRANGIRSISPLIEGRILHRNKNGYDETILVLGVDLLASTEAGDTTVRNIQFEPAQGLDFRKLLADPSCVIVTESFSSDNGLQLGDDFVVSASGGEHRLTVAGVLSGDRWAAVLDGNVLVTDIAHADLLLKRDGLIDRLDIVPEPGAAEQTVVASLKRVFGNDAVRIERPEARNERVDQMLAAFRFNLNALGHLAVLVGAFLIFNTVSIAVVRRRTDIGMLRALGVRRNIIRRVFLAEGLILGIVGSCLGILGGTILAAFLVETVSDAISINFVQTDASRLTFDWSIPGVVLVLGIAASLAASWFPATEAASTPPANTMRTGSRERSGPSLRKLWLAGSVSAAAGGLLLLQEPRSGLPITGYGTSLLLILSFILWLKPAIAALTALVRKTASGFMGSNCLLALAGLRSSAGKVAIAAGGLLMSVAMTVSVGLMVESFRQTVTTWMEQVLQADLYVSIPRVTSSGSGATMPGEFTAMIESIDGVGTVDPFRSFEVLVNNKPTNVGGGRLAAVRFENTMLDGRSAQDVMEAARKKGAVVVSESFARAHDISVGETVEIPTPDGYRVLTVEGVYYDYSSEKGYVIMDRPLFEELYDDDRLDSISVYLQAGADRKRVREEILSRAVLIESMPTPEVRSNDELRTYALEAFDQTFAVTSVVRIIAVIVATLGITTMMLAQTIDRQHELRALRYMGATVKRVARIVVIESAFIGVVGIGMGIVAGVILSWILTTRIMLESFGWTIRFEISPPLLFEIGGLVFIATLLAGIIPAREGARLAATNSERRFT